MPYADLFRRLKEKKPASVVLVGDVILDHYLGGEVTRVSPEAPVGIVDCTYDEYKPGGAANVAANLKMLGCGVSLLGVTGNDEDARILKRLLRKEGINSKNLVPSHDRPTIKKTRVMSHGQQLLRIDREKRNPVPKSVENALLLLFKKELKKSAGVVLSDYNKGILTRRLLREIIALAKKAKKPVIVDPKGDSFAKYKGADIITPNRMELEGVSGMACKTKKEIEKAARMLIKKYSINTVLATLGADGMALFPKNGEGRFYPTLAKEIFDVTGAGDTVVAVLAAFVFGGLPLEDAVRLANFAGGLQVAHHGVVGVGTKEIAKSLAAEAGHTELKIIDLKTAAEISRSLKRRGKKVVFTNGCFDLLHHGHIKYLQKAKKLGDCLMIGLNSDSSVKRLKGAGRPLLNEHDRSHIMAALDCVGHVIIFGELTPIKLIRAV
ncbi:MAG: D-glycero-beta-D-manno-heptose-7-phosphate kinase, partial [Nitrospinota bacterium]